MNSNKSDASSLSCEKVVELLVQYLDHELGDESQRMIAEHIQQCEHCAVEASVLASAMALVGTLPETNVSPNFSAQVVAEARKRFNVQKPISITQWWNMIHLGWRAAALVGAATALLVGYIGGRTVATQRQQPQELYFITQGHSSLTDTYQTMIEQLGQR